MVVDSRLGVSIYRRYLSPSGLPLSRGETRVCQSQRSVFVTVPSFLIAPGPHEWLHLENAFDGRKAVVRPLLTPSTSKIAHSSRTAYVSSVSMTSKPQAQAKRGSRPVFLSAALQRTFQQESWSRRLKSMLVISSFVFANVTWWLSEGIWHIPGTLSAARRRRTVHLVEGDQPPALDVYAPPEMQQQIMRALSNEPDLDNLEPNTSKPIVLYVHGGAWGSGRSSHYSQLATKVVEATNSTVLVLSYRLYPNAMIFDQAQDVATALRRVRSSFPSRKVIVLAHSSGAHIASLALLNEAEKPQPALLADIVIFTAGPFHLMHHFLFESQRGVALVSPMLPGALAETDHTKFDECSPTVIAEGFLNTLTLTDNFEQSVPALEGQLPARNIYLPDPSRGALGIPFPKTFIMTSTCDMVVPMYSSLRFAAALRKIGLSCELLVYDFVTHTDWVLDWSAVTKPRDMSDILDIDKSDYLRRKACVTHLGGKEIASLIKEGEQAMGTSAHVRDILRIIKAMAEDESQSSLSEIDEDLSG